MRERRRFVPLPQSVATSSVDGIRHHKVERARLRLVAYDNNPEALDIAVDRLLDKLFPQSDEGRTERQAA